MENSTANAGSSQSTNSYAKMAQKVVFPAKDQAIISEAKEGITIENYVEALSNLINPANIRFISRISNNRICTYLSSKSIVEELTEKHQKLRINNIELEIRPLINRMKRVILSNVSPIIPHSVIADALIKLGLKSTPSISFLRAGLSKQGLSHIMSFRRQFFIQPEDSDKIPETIQIHFDDSNHWIFLSSGNLTCFVCKQEGHTAKYCESANAQSEPQTKNSNNTQTINPEVINQHSQTSSQQSTEPPLPILTPIITGNKRPFLSDSSSSNTINQELPNPSSEDNTNNTSINIKTPNDSKTIKNTKKKPRNTSPSNNEKPNIHELLSPIKPILLLDKTEEFLLNYDQLSSFLERVRGSSNTLEIAKEYTSDTNSLIDFLHQIYPKLNHSSIKNRITRIIKKLQPRRNYSSNMETESENTLETDEDTK